MKLHIITDTVLWCYIVRFVWICLVNSFMNTYDCVFVAGLLCLINQGVAVPYCFIFRVGYFVYFKVFNSTIFIGF
jgi:hypothetical protein